MLPCPKCGHDNELGRIFCHQCGTKLDLSQIKAPGQGGKRLGRRKSGVGDVIKWVVRLAIIGVLVYGIYQMAQVPEIRPIAQPGSADTKTFYQQLDLLKQGVSQKRAVSVNITEPQLAGHIAGFKTQEAEGRGVKVVPSKLQIELGDGVVTTIVVGRISVGSVEKELYISYTGVPETVGGEFHLRPVTAAIGKLPIHPWILQHTSLMQNYFKQIYGGLEEKEVLDNLTKITVGAGVAALQYQPH